MRYIDADALIKKIYPMGICDGKYTINAKAVKLAIDNAPTADVVPKSEYDAVVSAVDNSTKEFLKLHDAYQDQKAEIDRLKAELDDFKVRSNATCKACGQTTSKAIEDLQNKLFNAKTEVAREIFEEIENIVEDYELGKFGMYTLLHEFAELKKKYTESENG